MNMTGALTRTVSLDDEWSMFITSQLQDVNLLRGNKKPTTELSKPIVLTQKISNKIDDDIDNIDDIIPIIDTELPICEELYISTKTKVLFLNQEIDISRIFWNIPIIEYWKPETGVIKKQMKIVSKTPEEYEETRQKMICEYYYKENIIKQINNPSARRIKFKDERKITIGISKKDIINTRIKQKNAFYNCFAIIIRLKYQDSFREIHVKIFNTGKMEIPGILNTQILEIVKPMILSLIQPFLDTQLDFIENKGNENVLINSNFNCGFYINREVLYDILKYKYHIQAIYDPCSYPGIQCKFYYNKDISIQNGKQITKEIIKYKDNEVNKDNIKKKDEVEVSFMIFRTGSVLIVGMCDDKVLIEIYEFLKTLLTTEFKHICQKIITSSEQFENKHKKHKIRKKTIVVLNNDNDNENDNDNVSNNQTKFNGKHLPIDNERTIL